MGCDIHLHVEVKIHGKWEHYNHPYIHRNYGLFCKMAGVRRDDESPEPISEPRGLPDDLSVTAKFDDDYWIGDGHSHSWLSAEEAHEVQEWYERNDGADKHPPLFGYVFGNDIGSGQVEDLKESGLTDCRIVFWFDN